MNIDLKQYLSKEYKLFTSYPFNDDGIHVKITSMWGEDCLWAAVKNFNPNKSYDYFRFVPEKCLESGEYRLEPV